MSIFFAPLTTLAADKQLDSYDKQIVTLTKKIEALELQLDALLVKREKREAELQGQGKEVFQGKTDSSILKLRPGDHVLGNPNAPVILIEYLDFECPACNTYHTTMKKIISEYEKGGEVAWVYRHFPLESVHPNAKKIAVASECVADQAGDMGFWKFADIIFDPQAVSSADMSKIDVYAVSAGANKRKFQKCLSGKSKSEIVSKSQGEARLLGLVSTPKTFVVVDGKLVTEITGAQPYKEVSRVIKEVLGDR